EAVAHVRWAGPWVHEVMPTVWEQPLSGAAVTVGDRATLQLAATNATHSAAAAVDLAYTAGEGSANYRRSPLQRQLRDIHAVTQHVGTAPRQYAASSRLLLGLPPDNPLFLL